MYIHYIQGINLTIFKTPKRKTNIVLRRSVDV